ncbi:exodeoxyribonuclease V subunit alpha [Neisseria chenwenguii]|uniref:exodeoxyribonuclease V subunit alpha n=1 Tax=Neisseria chenwenguii TaxID=1853278 RepID=UPI000F4E0EB5|nr:exodeoxyribonuclease V subunit alpha [Neisseria chenwenguii]ROV55484.1 exodeoxyribonuclease V subunit alpha [Neisseria chenwenguii]
MQDPEHFYLSPAAAATRFIENFAPDVAGVASPFVVQLFNALQNGHSFVRISDGDAAALRRCGGLVGGAGSPLVLAGNRLFLGRLWQLEQDLAAEIKRLAEAPAPEVDWMQTAQNLQNWFADKGSEGQRDAAALALIKPFMLITGGPGTGKTTTVAKLLGLVCANSDKLPRIALAAPTGKAAAHMARALHQALEKFEMPSETKTHLAALEGKTVHRLLKLRPPQMRPAFDAQNPLPLDMLVVDEASMLDVSLLLDLLRAVPTGCRLVFLGDPFQLPSVGVGAVLAALARETVLDAETDRRLREYLPEHGFQTAGHPPALAQNTAALTVSHRFGADSGIGCLARAVVAGQSEEAWAQFDKFPEHLAVMAGTPKQQAALLYRKHAAYWRAVDAGDVQTAFKHAADVVVLAAWRKDAAAFNEAYLNRLMLEKRARADVPWYAGQMLMVTRNDYGLDLFNGDIGLMMPNADSDGLAAYFKVSDGLKKIPVSRLPPYEPAFAMTVHKSQGSEYGEVWLLPPSGGAPAADTDEDDVLSGLNNALLYTAITRAREKFVFWGGKNEWTAAVETRKKRQTALADMIGDCFKGN